MIPKVRERITEAVKSGKELEKNVLRVLLGELQSLEARTGSITQEQAVNAVRKLIKNNNDTLDVLRNNLASNPNAQQMITTLEAENKVLGELLPTTLTKVQITEYLSDPNILEQLKTAKSDGQAMGIAMKSLKDKGAVEGNVVKEIVADLRAAAIIASQPPDA